MKVSPPGLKAARCGPRTVVIGLLAVIVGIYCIRNTALTLVLVAFVTGVYFIVHGIAQIGVAVSAKVPGRGVRAVLGVFSLAVGIIMVVWPAITLVILFTLVAAWLLLYGVALCVAGFQPSSRHQRRRQQITGSAGPRSSVVGSVVGSDRRRQEEPLRRDGSARHYAAGRSHLPVGVSALAQPAAANTTRQARNRRNSNSSRRPCAIAWRRLTTPSFR